jgi:hypothetical protein
MDAYRQTNINFKYISACLLGKQKSCNGYIFVKKGEQFMGYNLKKNGRKIYPIAKYTIDGEMVKKYNSLHEAYLDSNLSKSAINKSVLYGNVVNKQYYWRKIS